MTDDQANKFRIACTKISREELINMLEDTLDKRARAEGILFAVAELTKDIKANE
jgi:hypothetical protein